MRQRVLIAGAMLSAASLVETEREKFLSKGPEPDLPEPQPRAQPSIDKPPTNGSREVARRLRQMQRAQEKRK